MSSESRDASSRQGSGWPASRRPRVSLAARLMLLMMTLAGSSIGLALALQDRSLSRDLEAAAAARLGQAAMGSQRLLADHLQGRAQHFAAVARTPEFRANLETGNAANLRYHARELLRREGAKAVVFFGRRGQRTASAGSRPLSEALGPAFEAAAASGSAPPVPPGRVSRGSACVGAEGDRSRLPAERFEACAEVGTLAQATLVDTPGGVVVAISVPLVTRGRRLGELRLAEPFPAGLLAGWSELTGAALAWVGPGRGGPVPLSHAVHDFRGLELRASSTLEREEAILAHARRNLIGIGVAALVLALAASALLARGFVRPIREIRRATERVGRGELSARLDIRRNDEIGDVAAAFNATLGRLQDSHNRVRVAQRLARFGDWSLAPEREALDGSPEFWRIVGLPEGGRDLSELLSRIQPEDRQALARALARCQGAGHSFRLEVRTVGASPRTLRMQAQRVEHGRQAGRVEASVQDITEQRSVERQIRYLAYHDSLTGLGNRRFFEERLALALAEARIRREPLAVLFLDLDRFKGINDTLGHAAGDSLLQVVASRLLAELPSDSSEGDGPQPAVARLGGDEFMILLPAPTDSEAALALGRGILRQLEEPVLVEGESLVVTGSVGVAIWPDDGHDVEDLLRSSDTAMYYAKASGPNQVKLCTESLLQGAQRRLQVEMRLREALERDDLELHYQPRVDAQSGAVVGFEALLRWRDPELGVVSPADFVPIAEDAGLIRSLGRWVLRRAALQTREWRDMGMRELVVSVNLSARQLHPEFVETFDEILAESGLAPEAIELEVTETAVVEQADQAVAVLEALRRRGARIALDDFGTGYSSFGHLRDLPIDALKIDRSFVKPMSEEGDAGALVAAMVSMARVLRLRVVVEGVEEERQRELLVEMGCDELQGFLFGEATAASEATRLLGSGSRRARKRRRRS